MNSFRNFIPIQFGWISSLLADLPGCRQHRPVISLGGPKRQEASLLYVECIDLYSKTEWGGKRCNCLGIFQHPDVLLLARAAPFHDVSPLVVLYLEKLNSGWTKSRGEVTRA
jgi:hypothetical protein